MSVRGEKEERLGAGTGRGRGLERVADGGVVVKELWMSAIFSLKNTVKSSAMRED